MSDKALEEIFADLFELVDDQIAEDLLQIIFRTSYLKHARHISPQVYRQCMRLALSEVFGTNVDRAELAKKAGLALAPATKLMDSDIYGQIREEIIQHSQDLENPQSWADTVALTALQDRAVKRQFRMALTSRNPNAVTKALDSIAERAAPVMRNSTPNVTIVIGQDDLDRELETQKMVSAAKLIEGEVVS